VEPNLIASRWDAEYRHGRYKDVPPIAFVGEILKTLQKNRQAWTQPGLYVGCGNGRNYLPLVDAGARVHGLDLSEEAIRQLRLRRPDQSLPLAVGDFRDHRGDTAFAYIIAIQVFQHGSDADVARYFANAATALIPGGLFFLRVNSTSTEIYHQHTLVERNRFGGFTICYDDGPKRGLPVHFYSREELLARTENEFDSIREPWEDVTLRVPPKTGTWAQWEGIWSRRS
jgi:SAM-dependent methyltransferase